MKFDGKRTRLPMPLLTGEVSSSEAMMTERFFIREEVYDVRGTVKGHA